jgi:hypothetical protein
MRAKAIAVEAPPQATVPDRASWYEYVAASDLPTMIVIEDRDAHPGTGAFWGELNSLVHKTLGSVGCVTNGSFRDVSALAEGFQILGSHVGPSHAHVHVEGWGMPVEVCGMLSVTATSFTRTIRGGRRPRRCLKGLADAVAGNTSREGDPRHLPGSSFGIDKLKAAMVRMKDIH